MLKKRVIPVLLLKEGRMVKGKQFSGYKDTGDPVSSAKVYNHQDSDELIFLDIDARSVKEQSLIDVIKEVAQECFMPLSVGGNINNLGQVRELLSVGADKVVINTHAYGSNGFIKEISEAFGNQCIVIAIDVKYENGEYQLYSHCGTKKEDITLHQHITNMENNGAGEILINSIDNDGVMNGYDLDLLKIVTSITSLPIIVLGGAGDFKHLSEAFESSDVSAVACASLFHFGDNNPLRAKAYLKNHNIKLKRI